MKMKFRGWRREVHVHNHCVTPVELERGRYSAHKKEGPLAWHDALSVYGRLDDLALTGSFLVELKFDDEELGSWLMKYSSEFPERALRLLALAQAEAMIAMSKGAKNGK